MTSKSESNKTCTRHPDKEAVGNCAECGKAICDECKVEHQGKMVCSLCLDEKTGIKKTAISRSRFAFRLFV